MNWAAQCGAGCFRAKANNQFLIEVLNFYLGYISDEALGKAGKWMGAEHAWQCEHGAGPGACRLLLAGEDGPGRKLKSSAVHHHPGREERPQTGLNSRAPFRFSMPRYCKSVAVRLAGLYGVGFACNFSPVCARCCCYLSKNQVLLMHLQALCFENYLFCKVYYFFFNRIINLCVCSYLLKCCGLLFLPRSGRWPCPCCVHGVAQWGSSGLLSPPALLPVMVWGLFRAGSGPGSFVSTRMYHSPWFPLSSGHKTNWCSCVGCPEAIATTLLPAQEMPSTLFSSYLMSQVLLALQLLVLLTLPLLFKSVKSSVCCTPTSFGHRPTPGPGGLGLQPSWGCSAASSELSHGDEGWQWCWELS